MNKILGVTGVVGAAILLAGCSLGSSSDMTTPVQTMQQEQSMTQTQEQMGPAQWASELAKGKKMQCSYSSLESDVQSEKVVTKMYAEQGRFRTETEIQSGTMISLLDGKTMYNWMKGEKKGTKLDMECMQGFEAQQPVQERTSQTYKSSEEVIQNTPNISCTELAEEVDFTVPSDVVFTDQCAVLQQSMESMKKIQNMQGQGGVPANIPTNIPDDVKAMMGQ